MKCSPNPITTHSCYWQVLRFSASRQAGFDSLVLASAFFKAVWHGRSARGLRRRMGSRIWRLGEQRYSQGGCKYCFPVCKANHSRNPVYSKRCLPSTRLSLLKYWLLEERSSSTCSCSARAIRTCPVMVSAVNVIHITYLLLIDSPACLPQYTSDQTYYHYPAFNAGQTEYDTMKFAHKFRAVQWSHSPPLLDPKNLAKQYA